MKENDTEGRKKKKKKKKKKDTTETRFELGAIS